MITEFLQQHGIKTDECPFSADVVYEFPPAMLSRIAEEFGLSFERGSSIALTTTDGSEIELVEATVH